MSPRMTHLRTLIGLVVRDETLAAKLYEVAQRYPRVSPRYAQDMARHFGADLQGFAKALNAAEADLPSPTTLRRSAEQGAAIAAPESRNGAGQ